MQGIIGRSYEQDEDYEDSHQAELNNIIDYYNSSDMGIGYPKPGHFDPTNKRVTEHFKYTECACSCCDRVKLIPVFFNHMKLLEQMRQELGFAITINSGYRCPAHNKAIGGAVRSQHMKFATDIRPVWVFGVDDNAWLERLTAMYNKAEELKFGGLGKYSTFIHMDLRPEKTRWRG